MIYHDSICQVDCRRVAEAGHYPRHQSSPSTSSFTITDEFPWLIPPATIIPESIRSSWRESRAAEANRREPFLPMHAVLTFPSDHQMIFARLLVRNKTGQQNQLCHPGCTRVRSCTCTRKTCNGNDPGLSIRYNTRYNCAGASLSGGCGRICCEAVGVGTRRLKDAAELYGKDQN